MVHYISYYTDALNKIAHIPQEVIYQDIANLSIIIIFIFVLYMIPHIYCYVIFFINKKTKPIYQYLKYGTNITMVFIVLFLLLKHLLRFQILDANLLKLKNRYAAIAMSCFFGFFLFQLFDYILSNGTIGVFLPWMYILGYCVSDTISNAFAANVSLSIIFLIINLILFYIKYFYIFRQMFCVKSLTA
jgi:hypothetical protein